MKSAQFHIQAREAQSTFHLQRAMIDIICKGQVGLAILEVMCQMSKTCVHSHSSIPSSPHTCRGVSKSEVICPPLADIPAQQPSRAPDRGACGDCEGRCHDSRQNLSVFASAGPPPFWRVGALHNSHGRRRLLRALKTFRSVSYPGCMPSLSADIRLEQKYCSGHMLLTMQCRANP